MTIQWRRNTPLNKLCRVNWMSICKSMNLEPYLTPYTKINSNLIKDLNIRTKAIKFSKENIDVNLCDLGLGSVFLEMTPKAQAIKRENR